jgi:hypothetical protein
MATVSVDSLHSNHLRILNALLSAVRILGLTKDDLLIVGGLGEFLAGKRQFVGDVDVLISADLCKRYWEFLEVLTLHGLKSVFDVFDRPKFPWHPCRGAFAHAKALTLDCCANCIPPMKHVNLDIVFTAADLNHIPKSDKWVRLIELSQLRGKDAAQVNQLIGQDHQQLVQEIKDSEKKLANRDFHAGLGLHYGW